ncbi:hypothetical protein CVT26_011298 [Gymnopilus dilepis]|uniref:Uncharacterized protein n=1 Tax=Gymnopilus dilepis TaxID=231916 RepID=A0A409XBV4_9AGAR|nr:hypothetical protein CVT26_011298 [Gymnopilus dilepis]
MSSQSSEDHPDHSQQSQRGRQEPPPRASSSPPQVLRDLGDTPAPSSSSSARSRHQTPVPSQSREVSRSREATPTPSTVFFPPPPFPSVVDRDVSMEPLPAPLPLPESSPSQTSLALSFTTEGYPADAALVLATLATGLTDLALLLNGPWGEYTTLSRLGGGYANQIVADAFQHRPLYGNDESDYPPLALITASNTSSAQPLSSRRRATTSDKGKGKADPPSSGPSSSKKGKILRLRKAPSARNVPHARPLQATTFWDL